MVDHEIKVISLDLDGVLFDGPSAVHPITRELGFEDQFLAIYAKQGENRRSMAEAITAGAKIWIGVPTDGTLDPLVENLPLMRGAEETVSSLKEWGYAVGCISSGVSQFFMKPFKKRLKLDFAFSNILGEKDGAHDGAVYYIMEGPQKAERMAEYLQEKGFTSRNLASVGDGENDIPLFRMSNLSIAFNPMTESVSKSASLTIRSKDLRAILPHFIPDS
ncbi:MAG: HAD-IB family phosphatase [Candidatus Thorarchaeota archaeon]